ncbi:MAG: hypothetical protein AB1489_33040 [Acidobacteriota bacterium]
MNEVSIFRLYLLRAMYLLIAIGLGVTIWPGILAPPDNLSHMASVVRSVLGAVSLLALLGLRNPLKMLPLLFFELIWKSIWVLAFGLPMWLNNRLDANTEETLFACLMGIVLVPLVVPWGYVFKHYFMSPGDRWVGAGVGAQPGIPADRPSPQGEAHG